MDNHFISFLEAKETGITFARIDSDISETLKNNETEESKDLNEKIKKLFNEIANNNVKEIKVESLKNSDTPAMILVSEQSRRMSEMSKMFGGMDMPDMFKEERILVLNNNNPIIKKITSIDIEGKEEKVNLICNYILDIALLTNKELNTDEMDNFINRSNKLLSMVIEL